MRDLTCEFLTDPLGVDATRPRLSWKLSSRARGARQTAYQILVASSRERLDADRGDLWDSGRVESDQCTLVEYDGKELKSRQRCYWKVRIWDKRGRASDWSAPATWAMGLLNPDDWQAEWIGLDPADGDPQFPWLRRVFTLRSAPEEARVYVAAMGYYELYVNGQKVDDYVLSPAVSQFNKRVWYLTHDVTALLRPGRNCIALWLGRGWYAPALWGDTYPGPIARAQLEVRRGRRWSVAAKTDATWRGRLSCIEGIGAFAWGRMGGERVDARQVLPDWNRAELDDRDWPRAIVRQVNQRVAVRAQPVEPNRIQGVIRPVSVKRLAAQEWLVDMGTNLTGWLDIKFRGLSEGQTVDFTYLDMLGEGDRYAFGQADQYVAAGRRDRFCSRFNYHGFRYVKIKGLPRKPKLVDIRAYLIHTDFASAGEFVCSNQRLNAIHDMIAYTLRCLSMGGVFVDCPHRERLGYGGDGQSAMESILSMYRVPALLTAWTASWRDCQRPNGDMPHIAPNPCSAGGGPVWCGFILTCTYYNYLYNGDKRLVAENYPAIRRWFKFVESHCENNILRPWPPTKYRNWYLGDWAVPDGVDQKHEESIDLINNAFRIYCYDLAAQLADVLGKRKDAQAFRQKAESARRDAHREFFHPETGAYADGDQLDLAFPLLVGMTPDELRDAVRKKLEHEILVKNDGHLAVGLVGTYFLQKQLLADDRNDLMFTMTNQSTCPSYGYMLRRGATTTWEYWDGRNSHIHNCYNAIGAWFYQGLAGIRPDPAGPGFEKFIVRPAVVGDVKFVDAAFESPRGRIEVKWRRGRGKFELDLVVPPNSSATVCVPTSDPDRVTESGAPAAAARQVTFLRAEPGYAVFRAPAGRYAFASRVSSGEE